MNSVERQGHGARGAGPPWTPAHRPLWPHQERALELAAAAVRAGRRAVLITAPCGAGKTAAMAEFCRRAVAKGRRAGIFTNRKILTEQAGRTLAGAGVAHGYVARGFEADALEDVQVLSFQTVNARVGTARLPELPPLDVVNIDEAHSNKAETARGVIAHYLDAGAVVLGWTATPLGLGGLYQSLITAGTPSELRKLGALVPCDVYAPDEPDMRGVKLRGDGEFVAEQASRRAMETLVFGNVFDHWLRLNPFRGPTLLWAPGVAESRWFAEQFRARGVAAAHIDGETDQAERHARFAASEAGGLPVICSCGVLREGVDLPWVAHGILIQPCAALTTFLQITGRLLRAHPGKTRALLQDHAGAFHRHGSPNADREWALDDNDRLVARRLKKAREGGGPQPICCPRCGGVRAYGPKCPHCGHEHKRSVRHVRMVGGQLVRMVGDVVKRKRQVSGEQRAWTSCLYAAAARGRTLQQAAGDYRRREGVWPPGNLECVPPHGSLDWRRPVVDVYPWLAGRRKK